MDDSDHSSISASTPIKPTSTTKLSSSVTDENDQRSQQMGMNPQSSKKPMTKHFMAPTISAASKAIAPRKKILAERNEISDTNIQETPNIDNSEDSYSIKNDSSLKPYDHLGKNYPSPRPQFLRYKPNRRREIVLRHENEAKEERVERSNSGKDISLPCKKYEETNLVCASEEVEEIDEGDEEVEEEEEEEKEGVLKRALKLMLVLFVLVFSTLYISSMNSPEILSTLQAMKGFKDGYFKIYDHVYGTMRRLGGEDHFSNRMEFKEIVKMLGVGSELLDGNIGLMKVNQTVIVEWVEEEEMVKDVYLEKVEEISDTLSEVVEIQVGDTEVADEKKRGDDSEMVEQEGGESEDEDVCDHDTTKTGDVSDQMVENFEFDQMPIMSNAFEQENEFAMEAVPEEVINPGDEDLEMIESNGITKTENVSDSSVEVIISESMDDEITSSQILLVIGVTIFLATVASLVLAVHLKKKRNATSDCAPITISCMNQSGATEKYNSELPSESEEQIKYVENECVDSKELNQSGPLSIELLGEFSVGEISMSSFKSCGLSSSNVGESEVNSICVSFSAKNMSPSIDDFTPQKKMMQKEKLVVAMTPVRRSSRIRSRAITSP